MVNAAANNDQLGPKLIDKIGLYTYHHQPPSFLTLPNNIVNKNSVSNLKRTQMIRKVTHYQLGLKSGGLAC